VKLCTSYVGQLTRYTALKADLINNV